MKGYYEERGEGNPQSLIMVHGAGGSSATWYLQLKTLSKSLHCVAIDLNGHGRNPDREESTLDSYLDDIESVCNQLDRPFLMGHSMGGALAQLYALDNPEKLSGIILVGTGARLRVLPNIFDMLDNDFESYVNAVGEYMFHESANPKMIEASKAEVWKCKPSIIKRDYELCNDFDIMETVQGISVPTLIIVGRDDLMTPLKYAEYLHNKIPDSEIAVIEYAGHSVMLEQSSKLNEVILNWIRKKTPAT